MHEPQLDHANTTTLGRQARYAVTVSVANSPSGRKIFACFGPSGRVVLGHSVMFSRDPQGSDCGAQQRCGRAALARLLKNTVFFENYP